MPTYTTPPSLEDIHAMADAALAAFPMRLARHVSNVAILVEDIADDETLADMAVDNPWELTGLYRGTPLSERGANDVLTVPDTVLLFREAILLEWIEEGESLPDLVASVLVHEIAHHFGFSDADIAQIEADMEL
jgi:acetylglutamate kinase